MSEQTVVDSSEVLVEVCTAGGRRSGMHGKTTEQGATKSRKKGDGQWMRTPRACDRCRQLKVRVRFTSTFTSIIIHDFG